MPSSCRLIRPRRPTGIRCSWKSGSTRGAAGKVYPLPFTDRIAPGKIDQAWDAVHLENRFLRVMVLPQLGGRIHVGQDKTNGYDFFYRQQVIKPALVGLAGPWISGGVEVRDTPLAAAPSALDLHARRRPDRAARRRGADGLAERT